MRYYDVRRPPETSPTQPSRIAFGLACRVMLDCCEMPNVLLIGGTLAFFRKLSDDSRWNVVRAVRGESASRDVLGDPRRWHLIIDESGHYDMAHEDGDLADVSGHYLGEAERAHTIHFAGNGDILASTVSTVGSRDLEFHATSATEAAHLVEFVDEFEKHFERVHLKMEHYEKLLRLADPRRIPYRPLFTDSYGNPLIVLADFVPPILYIIDLSGEEIRLRALEYLCYRAVPKLWPEVYADQHRPRRVAALEEERATVIAQSRQRVGQIDSEIDNERAYYAQYAPLTELADDALKHLVRRTFEDVFGCQVRDLDEELAEDESKTLDLLVQFGDWRALVEVRSASNRGATTRGPFRASLVGYRPDSERRPGCSGSSSKSTTCPKNACACSIRSCRPAPTT